MKQKRPLYRWSLPVLLLAAAMGSLGPSMVSPAHAEDISALGGDLTSDIPPPNTIQVHAPNVTDETRRQTQINGFSEFHSIFTVGNGLGPKFNNASCAGCHEQNGRGPIRFTRSGLKFSSMVVKVSLRGLQPNGAPRDVPGIGEQLLDHQIPGTSDTIINLQWKFERGSYPDGTRYTLRRPDLRFRVRGRSTRGWVTSLRMSPPVIGPGLLDAIPDATILEMEDPRDANRDGISGRANYVLNVATKEFGIGRFGFRASHPTIDQQLASALFHDMGITNSIFSLPDEVPEFSDESFNKLRLYQILAGVPRTRDLTGDKVKQGKALFQKVGCDDCHRMSVTTVSTTDPELNNQRIHPFTDLLLHDMGRDLADGRAEFRARGSEWRTTPLWGLGYSRRLAGRRAAFLHDGRARTPEEAILWHGGEADRSRTAFKALTKAERAALLAFLDSL